MTPTITAVPGVDTIGTTGDDVILGTSGDDHIEGGRGKDRICGLGGNDVLYGGPGRDRLSGGPGNDHLLGEGGLRNRLVGGAGADHIMAYSDGDSVAGNGGADYIYTYSAEYTVVLGGPGDDVIITGHGTKLDAGTGTDDCALSGGVAGVGCETLRLFCLGSGEDLPTDLGSLAGLTTAPGDFDGNGEDDTVYMWHDPVDGWILHIELDNGYGARDIFGQPAENLAALGGFDINGDGIDEVFAQVGLQPSPAGGHRRHLDPHHGPLGLLRRGCRVRARRRIALRHRREPRRLRDGTRQRPGLPPGRPHVRLFVQTPWDADTWLQSRYDFTYEPRFGIDQPEFVDAADATSSSTRRRTTTSSSAPANSTARGWRCPDPGAPPPGGPE